jgi:hypothetical protein
LWCLCVSFVTSPFYLFIILLFYFCNHTHYAVFDFGSMVRHSFYIFLLSLSFLSHVSLLFISLFSLHIQFVRCAGIQHTDDEILRLVNRGEHILFPFATIECTCAFGFGIAHLRSLPHCASFFPLAFTFNRPEHQ